MTDAVALPDYGAQRARFLAAVQRAGGALSHWRHPLPGPQGEALYTDVALIGPAQASRLLVIISGTHGVEGYYGSESQIAWLGEYDPHALPPDTAAVLIHLINPWGTAWLRRVNEDNIDLNRNFVDFGQPLPVNADYEKYHAFYHGEREPADRALAVVLGAQGWPAVKRVVEAGQYRHADGLFFGGVGESWSRQTLKQIIERHLSHARRIISFDLHTGAGAWGHPMLLAISETPRLEQALARQWFGEWLTVLFTGAGRESDTGVTASATGYLSQFMLDSLPGVELIQLVIECGTLSGEQMHQRVRADHWLHLAGDPLSPAGRAVKQALVAGFWPADEDWRELVALRTRQIFRRAWRALAESEPL